MVNMIKLDEALAAIDADPEGWRQGWWATRTHCQTAYCLAGHVVAAEDGVKMLWHGQDLMKGNQTAEMVDLPDGRRTWITDYAAEILDIDMVQRDHLFAASNTREDLGRMRDLLEANPTASPCDDRCEEMCRFGDVDG